MVNFHLAEAVPTVLFSKCSEPKRERVKPFWCEYTAEMCSFGVAIQEKPRIEEKKITIFPPCCGGRAASERLRRAANVMVVLLHSAMHY